MQAIKYDEWQHAASSGTADRLELLKHNEWTALLASKVAEANRRGIACFDHVFYTSANHYDLGFIDQQEDPKACPPCFVFHDFPVCDLLFSVD